MTYVYVLDVGVGLTGGRIESGSFGWANGERLLRNSGTPANSLVGRHSLFSWLRRTEAFDLLQSRGGISKQSHAAQTPASYVDDVPPLMNPCSPDGVLETNATATNCKVYVFHHLYIANNWRVILVDQLIKLIFSGVYDWATAVFSTLSGPDAGTMEEAAQLLRSFGAKFRILEQLVACVSSLCFILVIEAALCSISCMP